MLPATSVVLALRGQVADSHVLIGGLAMQKRNVLFVLVSFFAFAVLTPATAVGQHVVLSPLDLQSANIAVAGNDIHITNLAIEQAGKQKFVDVVIRLRPNKGQIAVHEVSTSPSRELFNQGENFLPGIYTDQSGNKYSVTGGGILRGGRVAWGMRSVTEGLNFDIGWATGPVKDHPMTENRAYPEGFSLGVAGTINLRQSETNDSPPLFCKGKAIGAAQIGEAIIVYRLHSRSCNAAYVDPTYQMQFRRVSD